MKLQQHKPFSQACVNNQQPLLEQLQQWLRLVPEVLEIGSGTGQHAVFFGKHLAPLRWQCSDLSPQHAGINAWLSQANLSNVIPPVELDVTGAWPELEVHSVFSANTAHIMPWPAVEAMFAGVAARLAPDGVFVLYGPFNRHGQFTSASNRAFDLTLRRQDAAMGLRDDRQLFACAARGGMALGADQAMPANNRLLVWTRG